MCLCLCESGAWRGSGGGLEGGASTQQPSAHTGVQFSGEIGFHIHMPAEQTDHHGLNQI